ncbi:unnamed protein product [Strongylus vulgaris]|uniref:Hydantoinase B/oxoprolinase domain-containing protein n=1 Tax=Strongylus vulgaris TaxID=40348 RepID=A0A3P7L8I9_STRVU|nr:unnamed protein product [Strongylus vulgaris]
MQYAVRFQIDHLGMDSIQEGDVLLSNHPSAGGSHLPDLTVITPVFFENIEKPVFFLANRGHHADIGGLVPGSMPPNATSLEQEGATFISFKVVDKGIFQENSLIENLMAPKRIPGMVAPFWKNGSELYCQGISLVCDLISEYGLDTVQAYMQHIQSTAEESVRNMLKEVIELILMYTFVRRCFKQVPIID